MRILCNMTNLYITYNNVPLKQGDVVPDYATITIKNTAGIDDMDDNKYSRIVYVGRGKVYFIRAQKTITIVCDGDLWDSNSPQIGLFPNCDILTVNLEKFVMGTEISVKIGNNSFAPLTIIGDSDSRRADYWTNHSLVYLPLLPFKIATFDTLMQGVDFPFVGTNCYIHNNTLIDDSPITKRIYVIPYTNSITITNTVR